MNTNTVAAHPNEALLVQFLEWAALCPRSYADLMEVWQSTCPRHSIWEDAIGDGLIQLDDREGRRTEEIVVRLTPSGLARLRR